MIKNHLITKEHNQDIIYLYLDNKYKITNDLYINNNLINNIYNYLNNNNLSYKNKDIFLVINNIIIAKLNKKLLSNKFKYLEFIHYDKNYNNSPSTKLIDKKNSDKIIKKVRFNINLENLIKLENINTNNLEILKIKTVLLRTKLLKNKNTKKLNEIQIFNSKTKNKLIKQAIEETNNEIIKYKKYKNTKDLLRYRKINNKDLSYILNIKVKDLKNINKKEIANKLFLESEHFNFIIKENYTIFIVEKHGNIKINENIISNLINKGYNYKEILTYYYPNTYISKFS